MPKRIKAFSGSHFVRKEILSRLPRTITIEFTAELDDKGEPIIAIWSPDYSGILSEARSYEEAIENAHDAILTFFEVPRRCANLIEYTVEDVPDISRKDHERIRLKKFNLNKQLANA